MRIFSSSITASAGGTSYSKAFVVDLGQGVCNIGVGITVTGSAECTLQHTFSDPFTLDLNVASNGTWLNNSVVTSAAGNQVTNYSFPPRAIRLALHSAASATATLNINQSSDGG